MCIKYRSLKATIRSDLYQTLYKQDPIKFKFKNTDCYWRECHEVLEQW